MNKEELLQDLWGKINSEEISKEEIASLLKNTEPTTKEILATKKVSHLPVARMLYAIGAVIVLVGIIFFIAQIWDDIGSFGRILLTLGLGIVFVFLGADLVRKQADNLIGQIFHVIGGLLIPGGYFVLIEELNISTRTPWPFTFVFGKIFLVYLVLTIIQKVPILTFFTIANGTAFVYFLVFSIIDGIPYIDDEIISVYLTMIVGASYFFLSRAFQNTWNSKLNGALYLFGSIFVFGATFSRVFDSELWQFLYFLVVFGGLYLSIYLKSQIILVMSTIFLIAHISYITSEYFADSLGWPISLVILGFIFIGLGYASVNINKKYINSTEQPLQ